MIVEVDGVEAHASTGGVPLEGDEPVVLFLHGAGMDSTVWQLQTRYFARHRRQGTSMRPTTGKLVVFICHPGA